MKYNNKNKEYEEYPAHPTVRPAKDEQKAAAKSVVLVKKIRDGAKLPEKGTEDAAAFDLYAIEDVELKPGETQVVKTGLSIQTPEGYQLDILPRSGFSTKGVTVRNAPGLVDPDYRGEVGVVLKYEPENLAQSVQKLYKVLDKFAKDFVNTNELKAARERLIEHVKNVPFESYHIKKGDRIAQVQLKKIVETRFEETNYLGKTTRGTGGFGSSGV